MTPPTEVNFLGLDFSTNERISSNRPDRPVCSLLKIPSRKACPGLAQGTVYLTSVPRHPDDHTIQYNERKPRPGLSPPSGHKSQRNPKSLQQQKRSKLKRQGHAGDVEQSVHSCHGLLLRQAEDNHHSRSVNKEKYKCRKNMKPKKPGISVDSLHHSPRVLFQQNYS